jgi:hypothetical protein
MNFCTYFDSNYASKGWVCHYTLHKWLGQKLRFYILCLDDGVYNEACEKKHLGVIPIKLDEVENYSPKLFAIKNTRDAKEYYATMSSLHPMYIFDTFGVAKSELIYYTDADMAFWSDPSEMNEIISNKSIVVVDHGFEPPRAKVRFNVGILAYRNDANCREFLEWWFERCVEWCKWETTNEGLMADQGYLNYIHNEPKKFKNTLELNPITSGINVGPWNAGMCTITLENGIPKITGKQNLICYHYHEFKLNENGYFPTGWKLNNGFIPYVYEPYYKLIIKYLNGEI